MAWQIFRGEHTDEGMIYTAINTAYHHYDDACKVAAGLSESPDDFYLVKKVDGRKFRGTVVGGLIRKKADLTEDSQVS